MNMRLFEIINPSKVVMNESDDVSPIDVQDVTGEDLKRVMDLIYASPANFEFIDDDKLADLPNKVVGAVALQLNQKLREFKEQAPTLKERIESEFKL